MVDKESLKILLVEDVPVNRMVAVKMLKHLGYPKPDEADDGQQAVDAAANTRYDIILMDIQMPVLNGLDAAKAILSAETEHKPVIVGVTAHALQSHQEECLQAGMKFHLSKPIELEKLKEVMSDCLNLL